MGIGLTRTFGTTEIPVWQGTNKDIQLVQGGFLLDTTGYAAGVRYYQPVHRWSMMLPPA
jgi:hypothetical protein